MNNLVLHYATSDLNGSDMRTRSKFLLFFLVAASINYVFCIQEAQAQYTDFRAYKEKSNRDFEARLKAAQMERRLNNPGEVELRNKAQKYGIQYVPPEDYSTLARSRFVEAVKAYEKEQEKKTEAAAQQDRMQQMAEHYYEKGKKSSSEREAAYFYQLAAQRVKEFPGAVAGETAESLTVKAARVFLNSPDAQEARGYIWKALQVRPNDGNLLYMAGASEWKFDLTRAEQFLSRSVSSVDIEPGNRSKAQVLLAKLPQERKRRAENARREAAAMRSYRAQQPVNSAPLLTPGEQWSLSKYGHIYNSEPYDSGRQRY